MNRAVTETAYIWFIKQDVIVYIMLQLEQDPGEDNQLIKHHCEAKSLYILSKQRVKEAMVSSITELYKSNLHTTISTHGHSFSQSFGA